MMKKVLILAATVLIAGSLTAEWVAPSTEVESEKGGKIMVGTYWRTTGDVGTTPGTHFIGTTDNNAFIVKVCGNQALRLEPRGSSGTPSIIGGHSANSIVSGSYGGFIGGGGSSTYPNQILGGADYAAIGGGIRNSASGNNSTVGGGYYNQANSYCATVSGGNRNTADASYVTVGGGYSNLADDYYATISGGYDNSAEADYSVVGGGYRNTASGYKASVGGGSECDADGDCSVIAGGASNNTVGNHSSIGGGLSNVANGYYGTIGGGFSGEASGYYSTVPGGYDNEADGLSSFAAGYLAKANHDGCFVWGDYQTGCEITSSAANQFIARAKGGVYFYTNYSLSTGAYLAAGSGSWSSVSDRNVKENFTTVDGKEILSKVADLDISSWNYKSQDHSIRHIGPMAQDFHAAFGVGDDDKHLTTVDVDGVALASIQALYEENQVLKAQVEDLTKRLEALEKDNR